MLVRHHIHQSSEAGDEVALEVALHALGELVQHACSLVLLLHGMRVEGDALLGPSIEGDHCGLSTSLFVMHQLYSWT